MAGVLEELAIDLGRVDPELPGRGGSEILADRSRGPSFASARTFTARIPLHPSVLEELGLASAPHGMRTEGRPR